MRSLLLLAAFISLHASAADRPNILWLTFEDSSPHLGCYGDANANTPNLDALAKRGLRYTHAWSNAPVCAPARTTIIAGRYAPSNGAEHMRSEVPMPTGHKMYPELLRAAGYYCTNNNKTDYNLTSPKGLWDDTSANAHYRRRAAGQPFFAIFNDTKSHESQIRAPGHTLIHDPAKVIVPPYMPDTPEVRHDWAQHFDNVTSVDTKIGKMLAELEAAGLADDTIVFSYADHGTGMPRSKRCPLNSGLQVPFIVHFPAKWKHLAPKDYTVGGTSDRLIAFVDLAQTALSIIGVESPDYMQGRAFAGKFEAPAREFNFGFRGRMDERYDTIRSATDGRYVYVRNFTPQQPWGQHVAYMFDQASTRVWHQMFLDGKLNEVQSAFWKPKASEELYDLSSDPYETLNLAAKPEHAATRERFAKALHQHIVNTRDLGFIPEGLRLAEAKGKSPVDAFADAPLEEILAAAELATERTANTNAHAAPQPAIRYWAATGPLVRGSEAVTAAREPLLAALQDSTPSVRTAAAEALGTYGSAADQAAAIDVLLANANAKNGNAAIATEALNALDHLGSKVAAKKDALAALPRQGPTSDPGRIREYPSRLLEQLSTSLGFPNPPQPGQGDKKKQRKAKQ